MAFGIDGDVFLFRLEEEYADGIWFKPILNSPGASNLGVLLGILVAAATYAHSKRHDRMQRDAELRTAFIDNPRRSNIIRWIEHRDRYLQVVLRKLNTAVDPYDLQLLSQDEQVLHQMLDEYLNYLEAVASLWRRRVLKRVDFRGLWSYYIERIEMWEPLRIYATTEMYFWEDLQWVLQQLRVRWWVRVSRILRARLLSRMKVP